MNSIPPAVSEHKISGSPVDQVIRILILAALVLLPFSHLRWLPNFGTTRPISSVLFVLALGLIWFTEGLSVLRQHGLQLKQLRDRLLGIPGSRILIPWLFLILLGILSAAITPFYGNFLQALNRLLGYGIIFATLYCGLYARKIFSMQQIAKWISLGYLPVLAYGIVEAAATLKVEWAVQFVLWARSLIVVGFTWVYRLAFFTTEPSFVGFQLILLIAIMPYVTSKILRLTNLLTILIAVIFAQSVNVWMEVGAYLVFWIFFHLRYRVRVGLALAGTALSAAVGTWLAFFAPFKLGAATFDQAAVVLNFPRLALIPKSFAIRAVHILNLIHTLIDTRGVGLGIGQYGQFWKEIFLRHFDPQAVDSTGELTRSLADPVYVRPWSVIFGIGVDLGLPGLLILLNFFYRVWRSIQSPHSRGIFFASLAALVGAYPIVTPHVWLALALLAAQFDSKKPEVPVV